MSGPAFPRLDADVLADDGTTLKFCTTANVMVARRALSESSTR